MIPKHIKKVQTRSRKLHARQVGRQTIVVDSATEAPGRHIVTVRWDPTHGRIVTTCTCNWSNHNGVACTHVMAALELLAGKKGRRLSYWQTEDEARRQRHKRLFLTRGGDTKGVWVTSRPAKAHPRAA